MVSDSLERTLMLGGIGGRRRRGVTGGQTQDIFYEENLKNNDRLLGAGVQWTEEVSGIAVLFLA